MYNSKVLNLFANPENAGRISKPDGIADAYNADQTAHVEFSLRVEDCNITACKFRAQANPFIIAVCSKITIFAIGVPVDEVSVTKDDIVASLGEDSDYDFTFCLDCLYQAIQDYKEKQEKSGRK